MDRTFDYGDEDMTKAMTNLERCVIELQERIIALERKAHTHYYAPDAEDFSRARPPIEEGIPVVQVQESADRFEGNDDN